MKKLWYVTGNSNKFKSAQEYLKTQGIEIGQKSIDIDEIQAETIEEVAIDKAKKAFEYLKEPLFVNDSGWIIPALNGFPGPYMKYINDWLSPEDFIHLMQGKGDRASILKQVVVYVDGKTQQVFERDNEGTILNHPGKVSGRSSDMVVSFEDGISFAEQKEKGASLKEEVWEDFANWYKQNIKD